MGLGKANINNISHEIQTICSRDVEYKHKFNKSGFQKNPDIPKWQLISETSY